MISRILLFTILLTFSANLFATNIRVVDLQFLINNNTEFENLLIEIENDQLLHTEKFSKIEIELKSKIKKIDELTLILENTELEKEINKYNNSLEKFNNQLKEFNIFYENQINILKNKILEKILELLKIYSLDNKIDLILDSNNYILSSNSINITELILSDLNKINFGINFDKFE